ncbi:hypothetical protein L873DRAFT_619819 [Choiromyces venosus 120613-1]|uniref:Uncharacterized protein n=1 Tax=Choiromyces venosus 120613-1 TaxID=1336337 RepID=A0A3N4IXV0_9PEZI|nr:hypothetical protein L873DRAFT_619819 [Choiromyces venosus 120613-1]
MEKSRLPVEESLQCNHHRVQSKYTCTVHPYNTYIFTKCKPPVTYPEADRIRQSHPPNHLFIPSTYLHTYTHTVHPSIHPSARARGPVVPRAAPHIITSSPSRPHQKAQYSTRLYSYYTWSGKEEKKEKRREEKKGKRKKKKKKKKNTHILEYR